MDINFANDPHFNVFFSYAGGNKKDLEHLIQLEDNITRAFLITLSNLKPDQQVKFLSKLLSRGTVNSRTKRICYDLQNLSSEGAREAVHGVGKKVLLAISGGSTKEKQINKSCFSSTAFQTLNNELQKIETENDAKDLKNQIKKKYNGNWERGFSEPLKYSSGIEISYDQLSSIYGALHDSRPDAWIYTENFAILIEAKIGTSAHNELQLFRHLTNKNGFNISRDNVFEGERCSKYKLVNVTWTEICDLLRQIGGEEEYVVEFRRYLVLSGQVLDLSFIVEKGGYNHETMRDQFPLFLNKLDKGIYSLGINGLARGKRPLYELWDYYGFEQPNGNIEHKPDYLIEFNQKWACLFLRTDNQSQMRLLLESNAFREILLELAKSKDKLSERFFIGLRTDRLIDRKRGQRKGEKFDSLSFSISLSEIENRVTARRHLDVVIDEILKSILELAVFSKRLSFGFQILYPDVTKIDKSSFLRKKNFELFNDSRGFIDYCINFVNDTRHLVDLMRGSSKSVKIK